MRRRRRYPIIQLWKGTTLGIISWRPINQSDFKKQSQINWAARHQLIENR